MIEQQDAERYPTPFISKALVVARGF